MISAVMVSLAALGSAAPAGAQEATGCSWPVKGNSDLLNVAFPDEGARYWLAAVAPVGATRVKITGRYPDARYFSFHAYDALQRPVSSIADRDMAPDKGSRNPFTSRKAKPGGRYAAYLEFTDKPANPPRNTFYTGANNPLGAIIYRVYVADDPASEAGSVPLPTLTVETADGATKVVEFGQCEPASPGNGGAINAAINSTSLPNAAPRPAPWLRAENPPFFDRAGSLTAGRVPANPVTDPVFGNDNVSFLANEHVAYMRGSLARQFGDVVVMRGKAPTFPDTRAGVSPAAKRRQLRYWSICMNEFATQRFVECISDFEAVLDSTGYYTIVIADPEDRPANATAAHGVNYLPWPGAYYDGLIIYRHMLPARDFAGAVQNLEVAVPITNELGEYGPTARYCAKETIEAQGVDACFVG